METIVITDNEWFDISGKLEKITFTNDKTYIIQAQENQIFVNQGSALPTEPTDGLLLNPIEQFFKFTFKTGDVIAVRVGNFLNMATINHITVAEVK